ncbi:MAG: zinc ABC transporter solute-binding protein [Bacteroidales bacterium]|nr:zinc ABC transporter solute-binding protein [Bacteroidales bacterium]
MMQKYIPLLLFVALVGCKTTVDPVKVHIATSIEPYRFFIQQVTGPTMPVLVMIPSGANHATYEPLPKQMVELESVKLYFMNGHLGFEKAWGSKIQNNYPNIDFVDLSANLNLLASDHSHGPHESDHGADPHYWMSPRTVKSFMPNILENLISTFPGKEDIFRANYKKFISQLDSLDILIGRKTKTTR